MNDQIIIEIATQALVTSAKVSAPILLTSLLVGVFMGLVQSVTQIQEQTLSFVPKFIAVGLVIAVSGSWMVAELVALSQQLFQLAGDLST
ncbi:MAG: flagellar biosynthetic protein FliQ [Ilumatobacteraceae bacterium]|jgi:flagellar biosynthesis protein FliQ